MQNEYSSLISELLKGNKDAWSKWTTLLEKNFQNAVLQQQLTETRKQLEGLEGSKENVHAISLLARMYEHALGGEQDFNKAMECYKTILKSGDGIALSGIIYQARVLSWAQLIPIPFIKESDVQSIMAHGRNVLQLAIDEVQDTDAMVSLAYIYETGNGLTEPDYAAAIKLYEQAIHLGNYIALLYRANMHMSGRGGDVNYPKARELLNELRENSPSESKLEYEQKIAVIDYLSSINFDGELRLAKAKAQDVRDNTSEHKRSVKYCKILADSSTMLNSISEPSLREFLATCSMFKNRLMTRNNDSDIDKRNLFRDELHKLNKKLETAGDEGPTTEDEAPPSSMASGADEHSPFQQNELDKSPKKPGTTGDKGAHPEDKAPDPTVNAFMYHYKIIAAKAAEMNDKAKNDKTYIIAAKEASKLCLNLTTAKKAFDSADKPDIQSLKSQCIDAINDAKPVLQDFRGWTRILMKFMNAIIKGLNATGLTHFGHFKPDALKKVEQFENDIAPRKNPIR